MTAIPIEQTDPALYDLLVWWVNTGRFEHPGRTIRPRIEGIGRNDPCTCGSGKKFKRCCG